MRSPLLSEQRSQPGQQPEDQPPRVVPPDQDASAHGTTAHGPCLVLNGHSTGGLTAALWAHRHPGELSALVLTSAWLETWGAEPVRALGRPVVRTLARRDPRMKLLRSALSPLRAFFVADGWDEERDGDLPDPAWKDDPYVTDWDLNPEWVLRPSAPIRPGWLLAVLAGHARVAQGLDIRCPVLSMVAARSLLSLGWTPHARHARSPPRSRCLVPAWPSASVSARSACTTTSRRLAADWLATGLRPSGLTTDT